jgi:hypothetical protein
MSVKTSGSSNSTGSKPPEQDKAAKPMKADATPKAKATTAAKVTAAAPAKVEKATKAVAAPQAEPVVKAATAVPAVPLAAPKAASPSVSEPALKTELASKPSESIKTALPAWASRLDTIRHSLPKEALDLKTPATRPAGIPLCTGTGATALLAIDAYQPQRLGTDVVTPCKVSVTYDDKGGYFAGAKNVKAWAQLAGNDGRPAATMDDLTLIKQADGRYVGTTIIAPNADGNGTLKEAALAFGVDGKWDSNMGANYRIGL